jgi:hypothetical protein
MASYLQCAKGGASAQVEARVTLVELGLDNEGGCGLGEGDLAVRWAMCLFGQLDQLCVCAKMCLLVRNRSSLQLATGHRLVFLECVVVPIFNRFGVDESGASVVVGECVCECVCV